MIQSFWQKNRMEHPATLPDRQIDQPTLPNATTSRYDALSKQPRRDSGLLEQSVVHRENFEYHDNTVAEMKRLRAAVRAEIG